MSELRSGGADPGGGAQRSADRLAVALEEVGFDVGRSFPLLRSGVAGDGTPYVDIGRVDALVAWRLAAILERAAGHGIVVSGDSGVDSSGAAS